VASTVRYKAFLSYSTFDDEHLDGFISGLATLISREVHAQTGQEFPIFQDRKDIHWGESWERKIGEALDEVTYLIAFITPKFFTSPYCIEELSRFVERERELSRQDLILPVYLITVRELEGRSGSSNPNTQLIRSRQRWDLRNRRFDGLKHPDLRRVVAELAGSIVESMARTTTEGKFDGVATQAPVSKRSAELLDLIHLPSGSFVMGSDAAEMRLREKPAHRSQIAKGFSIGRFPVTCSQFRVFCEEHRYKTELERRDQPPRHIWKDPGFAQVNDQPAIYVSWYDAVEFCRWLSAAEGKSYRLPTQEEWEYACRADTETTWFCGDYVGDLQSYAWYKDNSSSTRVVGTKSPNPFGLFDMHGNVWEWCSDGYHQYAADGNLTTSINSRYRVAKGGSWVDSARHLRSSFRIRIKPFQACKNLGFRVVREDT
jgi:formylglycine-generating enzyme required for sulfatase activity